MASAPPARVLPGVEVGAALAPFSATVSPQANERYWRSAGVDHPRLHAGALYPPLAANLVVLTVQQADPTPLLQTRQRLVCHRIQDAPAALVVHTQVAERYERRGRDYAVIAADVTGPDGLVWTAVSTFTVAGRST